MREIKFRAWSKQDGMEYINDLYWFEEMLVHSFTSHDAWHPEYHFMQYTGLKDKNGKEIYEGDIVTYPLNIREGNEKRTEQIIAPITFEFGCFEIKADNYECNVWHPGLQLEVIGNIYENPELLE